MPVMHRKAGSTGDTHASSKSKRRAHYSVSFDDRRARARGELTLALSSQPTSPHGLASEGLFSLADRQMQARAEVSCHPGQCNGVRSRRLLISAMRGRRGCIEMRFPAGDLRISAEPSFPASVYCMFMCACGWLLLAVVLLQ